MQPVQLVTRTGFIQKDVLLGAYIADIHFGAMDPKTQYQILLEQFITPLTTLPELDLVAIAGDLFDHKAMANSDLIMYALKFVDDLIRLVIRPKNCTLIMVAGTYNHDAKQYKVLYNRLSDPTADIRIAETLKFEYVKGHRILCIPELAGVDEEVYQRYLFHSGWYDQAIMHGTIKGAVAMDNVGNCRLFHIEDFAYCTGPIISGHVHEPGCFEEYFYYTGSPYSWSFSDHDNKGFMIVASDKVNRMHFAWKQRIESFRYEIINLDDLVSADAKTIIDYIDKLKSDKGIDYLRIDFTLEMDKDIKVILDQYYRNKDQVKFNYSFTKEQKEIEKKLQETEEFSKYSYIYDKSLNEYEILSRYINEDKGYVFITADEIKKFIEEEF